ncbi:MAG: glutathione ABC transporter substrate-binding protein, partial [Desulfobacterales bacterium]|nr:glutathione ABC transporter substrate-binding protein [Desulfobacterales bacterium]
NKFNSKSRSNWARFSNPRMDELVNAQAVEMDPGKRKEILCEITKIINDEVPVLYRGGKRFYVLAKKNVKGMSDFRNGLLGLGDVWIDQ